MRCRSDIERNGYYTGKRCSRDAAWKVTFLESEDVRLVCAQHKNVLVKSNWWGLEQGTVTIEKLEA